MNKTVGGQINKKNQKMEKMAMAITSLFLIFSIWFFVPAISYTLIFLLLINRYLKDKDKGYKVPLITGIVSFGLIVFMKQYHSFGFEFSKQSAVTIIAWLTFVSIIFFAVFSYIKKLNGYRIAYFVYAAILISETTYLSEIMSLKVPFTVLLLIEPIILFYGYIVFFSPGLNKSFWFTLIKQYAALWQILLPVGFLIYLIFLDKTYLKFAVDMMLNAAFDIRIAIIFYSFILIYSLVHGATAFYKSVDCTRELTILVFPILAIGGFLMLISAFGILMTPIIILIILSLFYAQTFSIKTTT